MFFLYHVKSGVNFKFFLSNSTYFSRKSAFSTEIPLPVKTVARSRDVSRETKILHNTYSPIELVCEFV